MEGITPAFLSGFFCMFGNLLHWCIYRDMIVELTFQVWIPIKTYEVTKPNIKSAIFLRCLKKTLNVITCCHAVLCTAAEQCFLQH